ncbi:hypothetical protein G7Y89_g600 [Cudoniella acicularis]|uniref:Cytochrome P450 n=1 Tax=Cudoniella acicularis TaxID=354080 RepID=A0A8H4RYL2_9HELO|nr:hypothetical protein G7Y89_g600 [Cudoniella acicularis]
MPKKGKEREFNGEGTGPYEAQKRIYISHRVEQDRNLGNWNNNMIQESKISENSGQLASSISSDDLPLLLSVVLTARWALREPNPFALTIFMSKIYVVQGAENIIQFWKKSQQLADTASQIFCLKYLFGMPEKALQMYLADDSGFHDKPNYGSKVHPSNRVDYQTHSSMHKFMGGPRLSDFYNRWRYLFARRLENIEVTDEWIEMPDLMTFFDSEFASPLIEATCGPLLEQINPSLMRDLITYGRAVPYLSKGLPRWLVPKAYAIRDKLLANIKEWHSIARQSFDAACVDQHGDSDPYWGSEFIRSRQALFESFHGFDGDAAAASDLGLVWALTVNIVPTSMWVTLDINRDKELSAKIRHELDTSGCFDNLSTIDLTKLLTLPRLQGVYAETLRLRFQAIIARRTNSEGMELNNWRLPRDSVILVATNPAHMDPNVWNTGEDNQYPVDKFWAERFLTYGQYPSDGPISGISVVQASKEKAEEAVIIEAAINNNPEKSAPSFTMSNTAGHWFPYGGGSRICPGRHIAKRAVLSATATITKIFDIEILASDEDMAMDGSGYGFGMQRPIGKIPFRIRKRQ